MTTFLDTPMPFSGTERGVEISRTYTTEGVHPYDEVTWARRDVVMTNWRDGTVNFSQLGVEFPDSWSLNAVNIVTSKYFRGAAGSETRESSLRQLLDRVVDTYARAGLEHGYFASKADAGIFSDELTWMLLHQVFSFNSPVWFNVGTASKAQVSACFILAVNDTMESILNWYREEGLIFKGGSGAGLNLSRIRSSKELLSSGGTASGPVSFMRGADASAGTIKSGGACIAPWSQVYTAERGPVAVSELAANGEDFTTLSYNPILGRVQATRARAWLSGHKQLVHLVTDKGEFTMSADHPVMLMSGGYKAVGELTEGMSIRPANVVIRQAGYHNVGLHDGAKGKRDVHRLVAQDVMGLDIDGVEVHHIDRDPAHNGPSNLSVHTRGDHLRIHAEQDFAAGIHPLQRFHGVGNHPQVAGEHNGMSGVSGNRTDAYRAKQIAGMHREDVYRCGQVSAARQRMLNKAYEIVNTGGSIDTFDGYFDGRRKLAGKMGYSKSEQLTKIEDRFGSFDAFRDEVRAGNHRVLSVTTTHMSDVYDVEVDNDTPRDKSLRDGHNFMLVSETSDQCGFTGVFISNTRRAAKMVVLDVDHPDIGEFVATKAREENKIRVLRDAGFDMDLGGADINSAQYQNANNSVRVTDEFMAAVENGGEFGLRARGSGEVIETVDAKTLFRSIATAAWECADPGLQYDGTINDWHTCPESGRISASNPCSEYLHLDNSSCNLASLNLMKFLTDDGGFDTARFGKAVEVIITAMDISICFADFPTEPIGDTTRKFRQLGIGYANLGALLMATGHAYDSDGGRALAASITSLMTGTAYKRSAELAGVVGPYEGYARNADAHSRVMRKHAAANDLVVTLHTTDTAVHEAATQAWQECLEIGERNGWRNAQASVLAPTGCLTGDTLVTTDRGLARLSEVGDVRGDQWQDLEVTVSTDEGPRSTTKFFVNGEEPTRRIATESGYRIQGTLAHRIKVVEPDTGQWVWRRMADIRPGELVPVQLGTLVGAPRTVPLPVLDQAYYAGDRTTAVPDEVDAELAELVGYFMGDGSLHAKGIRLCVANTDLDVVGRIRVLSKGLFNLEPVVTAAQGYQEVVLSSVRLARWWQAAGFAKHLPGVDHTGKGWTPHVPAAIRETNNPAVYAAFLSGLFEADGTVLQGVPSVSTSSETFADDVRTLLLTLGFPTTTREAVSGWGGAKYQVRLRNLGHAVRFGGQVGFMSSRKASLVATSRLPQSGNRDRIHLPTMTWLSVVPVGHELRGLVQQGIARGVGLSRDLAERVAAATGDQRVRDALGYVYETVRTNEDGGVQPTYDLSVPSNVTYVAAGFVSHNTIGFMMDCDTTGIEPDFSLVKFKKLVGGGSMQIVNQTVPRALASLGYDPARVTAIVAHIATKGHVVDAPGLDPEHYAVFDCAMGERPIAPMGHVRMMAAAQPFLSGGISKTVNMSETATVEEVEGIYFDAWKLGIKALAIYRDNCKVGQPLSSGSQGSASSNKTVVAEVAAPAPVSTPTRTRLPRARSGQTVSFAVGGAKGYVTSGCYPNADLGEMFVKMSKQGSTLAGVMDAFSIAVSIALQYGVPLETYVAKFVNMRFEPSGMTDDPDVRIATSVVDYLFRRLALDNLPQSKRAELGIFSVAEREAQVEATDYSNSRSSEVVVALAPDTAVAPVSFAVDAPLCMTCGIGMRRAGSCFVCEGCGSTSGCS